MLTQWHLPSPQTSIVKSSLFLNAHSSPLTLGARLHRCHVNHSRYINNGWTFSRQTLYFRNWLFMTASSQSLLIKKLLTFPLRFFKYSPYPSLPVPSPRPPVFMVRFYIFSHSLLVWKYLFFLGTQCLGISTALSPPREPTSLFHNVRQCGSVSNTIKWWTERVGFLQPFTGSHVPFLGYVYYSRA